MSYTTGFILSWGVTVAMVVLLIGTVNWSLEKKIEKLKDELVKVKIEIANLKGRSGK